MLPGMSSGRRSAQDVGVSHDHGGDVRVVGWQRDQHLHSRRFTGLSAMIGLASIFVLGFSSNGPLEIGVPIMTDGTQHRWCDGGDRRRSHSTRIARS